uniref:Uncharacterized protein n=1 Tax=Leersia perrieri TaxID=77586 RepID=A0A0D9XDP2_9ORYZ
MDAVEVGGGGGAPVAAAAGGSNGFIHAVVRCYSSPLFFWLLTIALVAAIHLVSTFFSPSSREEEEDKETDRNATRRRSGGFAAGEERAAAEEETARRNDDKILEMMRSFSFMHTSEEEFMEGLDTYDRVVAGMSPEAVVPPVAPPTTTFSFRFQHQLPEILRETAVVSGEIPVQVFEEHEPERKISVESVAMAKRERELEAEVAMVEEEEEQRRDVVEAAAASPRIVATTHNYRFLTERDFRGFVKEPEAITVRVEESFVPSPELEALAPAPAAARPEERRVVDVSPRCGFLTEDDFRPVSAASQEKRTPPPPPPPSSQGRRPAASSPSAGRTSFASEFSGFGGDSDSESTASDGYSVKDLAVDSDSDWFLSEKDFPSSAAAAHDAGGNLRGFYKAKVLKALEALDESASNLERSFQDSTTTVSPGSVRQPSPDIIGDGDGSAKYPEDMWSRSPSPDVEYKEDDQKGIAGEEAEVRNMDEEEEVRFDMSDDDDDERSPSQVAISDEKRSPRYSERDFACTDGHELISDVWKEIVNANDQSLESAHEQKRGPEPTEEEFAGTENHPAETIYDDHKAIVSTMDDPSYAVISDDKSIPETPEREFSENDHPYGLVSDAKINSEPTKEETERPNDRQGNATRHVTFSVAEKGKDLDVVEEDQEDKWKDLTEEEEDELESLWEHQDLIEQLKLELKKVRSIGLPTILEESETPKAPMEDLKPWRIDAKFLREDPMDELNKFFKSYRERMRKFDILCYQKMYAIDFLQLRGLQQSTNSLKSLSPTVTSILSHNFRSSRRKSPEDPSERFLKELRYDLETVYVGQMCLSWEFLRWQYEQARDLPESDPYHSHQYNQVAGEFQQFQVVVQRFVEDESFKGPRLPNYINNRCVLRNLLQVPVIKEDSLKDRMEDQRKGNYVISSEELEEIMEECMHVFWEFIRSDKVETTSVLKGLSSTHVELQDPLDHDLMMHIHATLQKKEKRLKDLLRTGNCIVKKFKKPKEGNLNQNLFFSQVDMRLVARVLRMPRITSEQLQWCKAKLDKIALVDRRIHREASFLLFPC